MTGRVVTVVVPGPVVVVVIVVPGPVVVVTVVVPGPVVVVTVVVPWPPEVVVGVEFRSGSVVVPDAPGSVVSLPQAEATKAKVSRMVARRRMVAPVLGVVPVSQTISAGPEVPAGEMFFRRWLAARPDARPRRRRCRPRGGW